MTEDQLDDADVAVMCDIGSDAVVDRDASKQARVEDLIARGLVVRDPGKPGEKLSLTDQAQKLLAKRGVGINEA